MSQNKKLQIILMLIGSFVLAVILILILIPEKGKDIQTAKIGFILSGSVNETGWNGMHYNGVKSASEKLNVELLIKENVAEFKGECKEAVKELADEGASMILLSSYNYSEEVKELVKEYPNIAFYANSFEYQDENMTSYFVRMYQARYLSGIIAGLQTTTNKVGYVAAMANNEVNRGISAFTLGVRSVNPEASVIVAWTGTWDDEEIEKKAACDLIEKVGVDIITYHQNQAYVIEVADEKGVMSIGYHQAFDQFSDNYLTSVVCDWEVVYEELIQDFLRGKGNEIDHFWIGITKDAVGLSNYSSKVSKEAIRVIEKIKEEMKKASVVFVGPIYDREGNLRCGEKELISDEVLLEQFDWYVEGVEFYEE